MKIIFKYQQQSRKLRQDSTLVVIKKTKIMLTVSKSKRKRTHGHASAQGCLQKAIKLSPVLRKRIQKKHQSLERVAKRIGSKRKRNRTRGQFLEKSTENDLHCRPIPSSWSILRAQLAAARAAESNRRKRSQRRSRRSAARRASKATCSIPLLALRHASRRASPEATRLANPSRSLRRKARTGAPGRRETRRGDGATNPKAEGRAHGTLVVAMDGLSRRWSRRGFGYLVVVGLGVSASNKTNMRLKDQFFFFFTFILFLQDKFIKKI